MTDGKKQVPFEEGLWRSPSEGQAPQLIGSRCPSCGEIFFPRKKKGLCTHCYHAGLEEILLSGKGKIATFTIAEQAPAGGFYHGPVPFAYGAVDLIDGVEVQTLFAGDLYALRVGMDVEMIIDKLFDDGEGNQIMTYKFKAAEASGQKGNPR
ncbi:MAG: OB-fold domain-containing protein [Thermodesulfobacteriota bacterium]